VKVDCRRECAKVKEGPGKEPKQLATFEIELKQGHRKSSARPLKNGLLAIGAASAAMTGLPTQDIVAKTLLRVGHSFKFRWESVSLEIRTFRNGWSVTFSAVIGRA
jgi:hypothetical protein